MQVDGDRGGIAPVDLTGARLDDPQPAGGGGAGERGGGVDDHRQGGGRDEAPHRECTDPVAGHPRHVLP